MITEDYVNKEIALLLREKGFDEPCDFIYDEDNLKWVYHAFIFLSYSGLATNSKLKDISGKIVTAPTVQMALKWLREVHGIFIEITCCVNDKYDFYVGVYIKGDECWDRCNYYPGGFETFEDACNEAMKFALENLI